MLWQRFVGGRIEMTELNRCSFDDRSISFGAAPRGGKIGATIRRNRSNQFGIQESGVLYR